MKKDTRIEAQEATTNNTSVQPKPTTTTTAARKTKRSTATPRSIKPSINCRDMRSYFKPTQTISTGAATKEGGASNGIKPNKFGKSGIIRCSKTGSGDQMDRRKGYISQEDVS